MSIQSIQVYRSKVEKIIQYGGTHNESALRKPFQELLDVYAQSKVLILIPEVEYTTPAGRKPCCPPSSTAPSGVNCNNGHLMK
jgi:hypothetical protein